MQMGLDARCAACDQQWTHKGRDMAGKIRSFREVDAG